MSLLTDLKAHLQLVLSFRKQHMADRKDLPPLLGMDDFVLTYGRDMPLRPKYTRDGIRLRRGTPKQCFSNATHAVFQYPALRYAEGYVQLPNLPIPIHHAWVVTPAGLVYDHTLGHREGAVYLGVDFDWDFLAKKMQENQTYGLYDTGIGMTDLVLGRDKDYDYGTLLQKEAA